jgi:hypothetical protein
LLSIWLLLVEVVEVVDTKVVVAVQGGYLLDMQVLLLVLLTRLL